MPSSLGAVTQSVGHALPSTAPPPVGCLPFAGDHGYGLAANAYNQSTAFTRVALPNNSASFNHKDGNSFDNQNRQIFGDGNAAALLGSANLNNINNPVALGVDVCTRGVRSRYMLVLFPTTATDDTEFNPT